MPAALSARLSMTLLAALTAGCVEPVPVDGGADASFDTPRPDAPVDAGLDTPDARDGGPPDAWEPELLCLTPGTRQFVPCTGARAGEVRLRVCSPEHVWEYAGCGEHCGGAGCGRPGSGVVDTAGCPAGSVRVAICDGCRLGPYGPCVAPPEDLDRDGVPATLDCDDGDPRVRPGTVASCGRFACGYDPATNTWDMRPGTRTCLGPGLTECERPPGCPQDDSLCILSESSHFLAGEEVRPCAAAGPVCGGARSRCGCTFGVCGWEEVTPPCPSAPTTPSGSCGLRTEVCGEGCGAGAVLGDCSSGCLEGRVCVPAGGCVPGTQGFELSGCGAGERRSFACDDGCALSHGDCEPVPPEVDVMLVLAGGPTSSLYRVPVAELVDALLRDPRVRVGVVQAGDFPFPPYGTRDDVPFVGLLAPTDDRVAIHAAIDAPITGDGDRHYAGVEALSVLADRSPHPRSVPFTGCPAGSGPGCWRPGAARVIVLDSRAHHDFPAEDGTLMEPYDLEVMPPPGPIWEVAAALREQRVLLLNVPTPLALRAGLEPRQALAGTDHETDSAYVDRLLTAIYSWVGEP